MKQDISEMFFWFGTKKAKSKAIKLNNTKTDSEW